MNGGGTGIGIGFRNKLLHRGSGMIVRDGDSLGARFFQLSDGVDIGLCIGYRLGGFG